MTRPLRGSSGGPTAPGAATWPAVGRLAAGALLSAALVVGAALVLAPFLGSLAWAAILAYSTWPVHRALERWARGRTVVAAALMTALLVLAVVGPVTLLSLALADDATAAFRLARGWAESPPDLPAWVGDLPGVGPTLTGWHGAMRANPGALTRLILERTAAWVQPALSAAGDLGRNLGRLAFTLLTVFFLYRHGVSLVADLHRVLARAIGPSAPYRLALVGATVRGVFHGVLLTALAQGLLAGLGFWVAGIGAPVLLGVLTALLALVPIGPPLVWGPAALWLLAGGRVWAGLALAVWGLLAVSGIDNVLRPYFIGGAARIPFLLVLFGVLGGLGAFGLLGLFLGPTILAVLLALWRDWAATDPPAPGGLAGPASEPAETGA